jgi:PTS system nitrogen regulatory IIA component
MMLTVKDVAEFLSVSEKTVYRWISHKDIPAYKLGETYRFNKVELLEWATSKRIKVSYKIFDDEKADAESYTLSKVIESGGIYYHVAGDTKEAILESIVKIMNLPDDIDREFLLEALMARESLGSTAIGDGLAIPHVRNPIIFHIDKPIISLCFLENPIDFDALDKKPVDTIFTIISPSIKIHLNILSRLSFFLRTPEFRVAIKSSSSRQDILDAMMNFEKNMKN